MARFFTILGCLAIAAVAFADEPLTHTQEPYAKIKDNIATGKAVIVDVREQDEWDAGHLKGAVLIPKSKLDVEADRPTLLKELDKEKIIYTHCRAGRRALFCGEILKKQGYDVRPLREGYEELVKLGFEKAEK